LVDALGGREVLQPVLADRLLQTCVRVGDDQLDTGEATLDRGGLPLGMLGLSRRHRRRKATHRSRVVVGRVASLDTFVTM
jgi:MYXO-CTERM domain-containing protein